MALDHFKTEREERIMTLYQVDPGFYKKIVSRSTSLGGSNRISIYHNAGEVPFIWEMQPGRPREAPNIEMVPPIRLPPAVHGLNMPKPRFHHPRTMAYISKYIKKLKMFKNMKLRLPSAVPRLSMPPAPKPKIPNMEVKVIFLKSLEKVKKIKNNIHIRKKFKNIHIRKKSKAKPLETNNGYASGTDESEGFKSCIIDGNFTPSPTNSDASSSSWSSSFSSNCVKKSPKKLRFRSMPKELRKWRITKGSSG